MEKNTVLAVVLTTLVLIGFYVVQGVFFPPKKTAQQPNVQPPVTAVAPQAAAPETNSSQVFQPAVESAQAQ